MMLLGIALTAVVGWLCLPRRLELGPLSGLSLGFLLASFGLSVELFLFSVAGLPLNAWLAIAPWIVAAGWLTWRSRPLLGVRLDVGAAVALISTGVVLAVWLPMERAMPLTSQSWDAWAIWLFKAKAFYLDGNIADYFARSGEFVGQPGYPLLTPLYSTWLYAWSGQLIDQGAKLTSPCYFLAALGSTWWILRRLTGSLPAGIGTALVALTPMVQQTAFGWAGYADTALSAYFVAAAGFVVLWIRCEDPLYLTAASLAATAAAWTKNEGQVFTAIMAAIAIVVIVQRRLPTLNWARLLLAPTLLMGAWFAVRATYGVDAAGFVPGVNFSMELFTKALMNVASKAFAPSRFALTFPLLLLSGAVAAAYRASLDKWAASVLVAGQLLAALLAYATGRNEIEWWLETSADRVVAQIAPLAILASTITLSRWWSEPSVQSDNNERERESR